MNMSVVDNLRGPTPGRALAVMDPLLLFPDPAPPELAQALDLAGYPWKAVGDERSATRDESARAEANWWAPGPLRRFHDRFGISEHVDLVDEPAATTDGEPAAGTDDDAGDGPGGAGGVGREPVGAKLGG